jgi:hypothetical protein
VFEEELYGMVFRQEMCRVQRCERVVVTLQGLAIRLLDRRVLCLDSSQSLILRNGKMGSKSGHRDIVVAFIQSARSLDDGWIDSCQTAAKAGKLFGRINVLGLKDLFKALEKVLEGNIIFQSKLRPKDLIEVYVVPGRRADTRSKDHSNQE